MPLPLTPAQTSTLELLRQKGEVNQYDMVSRITVDHLAARGLVVIDNAAHKTKWVARLATTTEGPSLP